MDGDLDLVRPGERINRLWLLTVRLGPMNRNLQTLVSSIESGFDSEHQQRSKDMLDSAKEYGEKIVDVTAFTEDQYFRMSIAEERKLKELMEKVEEQQMQMALSVLKLELALALVE